MRAAIYTRKSTDEGLEMEFNSLHHQRESGEFYSRSQGWTTITTSYDDGGFTGGNIERPALRRLLADIEAGKVDCVVVYKVDRLSRSLLDFGRLMELFTKHNVAFVSVTQQIDTSTSMGRLMLNVLLSFAQFERELVSERTRDKIAATRKKGKYAGGRPILGYDTRDTKLVVNELEAERVRAIFQLYLDHRSMITVVNELMDRGWRNKSWTTKKGLVIEAKPFDKNSLHKLLTNPTYIGLVKHKENRYAGEHEAIVDQKLFDAVQSLLAKNAATGGAQVRNKFGALLKGILHCSHCNRVMSPTHSKKGSKRYRYYLCTNAAKTGWRNCPCPQIPAGEIEMFVVSQIQAIGADPSLIEATIREANREAKETIKALDKELAALKSDVQSWTQEIPCATANRQADLHERLAGADRRATEIHQERAAVLVIDPEEVTTALRDFAPVWDTLTPQEQTRVVELLVARVDYDGKTGSVVVTFNPTGILEVAA